MGCLCSSMASRDTPKLKNVTDLTVITSGRSCVEAGLHPIKTAAACQQAAHQLVGLSHRWYGEPFDDIPAECTVLSWRTPGIFFNNPCVSARCKGCTDWYRCLCLRIPSTVPLGESPRRLPQRSCGKNDRICIGHRRHRERFHRGAKPLLIAAVSTLPSRVRPLLGHALDSMYRQARQPDAVVLSQPKRYALTDLLRRRAIMKSDDAEPARPPPHPLLTIVTPENDSGPGTKLLGALPTAQALAASQPGRPAYLVLFDDDLLCMLHRDSNCVAEKTSACVAHASASAAHAAGRAVSAQTIATH